MTEGQRSRGEMPKGVGATALIMAEARAKESRRPDRLFDDPFAQQFVDEAGAVQLWLANAERM